MPEPDIEGDFVLEEGLELECGRTLVRPTLHYAVYGRLNAARDNCVLVGHALSGSALVGSWWPELFQRVGGAAEGETDPSTASQDDNLETSAPVDTAVGDGRDNLETRTEAGPSTPLRSAPDDSAGGESSAQDDGIFDEASAGDGNSVGGRRIVDLRRDCVICVNLLGSCYGSTGPGSADPESGELYGVRFPLISIRDNVRAQVRLLRWLGVMRVSLAIGGSIGGMQALELAILYPELVEWAVIIGVAPLSGMGLALNHLQRRAIENDPDWLNGAYLPEAEPRRGLSMARQIGMLSYKSAALFTERFDRRPNRNGEDPWEEQKRGGGLTDIGRFDVAGFLDYQGERFLERFDANAYLSILRTMDTWDPLRGYATAREAYGRILARLTFVGISSDWLFPPEDVRRLAESVRECGARAEYNEMVTDHGHDAFLAEQKELVRLLHLPN